MAATREAAAPAAFDAGASEALYRKLSPGPGRSAQEVALHQRARIHGAMVEIVGERGYDAVTVRELARLAGVSTRAFYENFGSKEECFLHTYELVVQRAAGRIVASQRSDHDWQGQMRLAFGAFAHEFELKPQAARLAFVEAFAVGPAALERMWHAEGMFEAMIRESFARAPDGIGVSPLLVKGIVAGIERVARARLLAGHEQAFAKLGDELLEWALCYRCEAAATALDGFDHRFASVALGELDSSARPETNDQAHGDERALILSAVAKLAVAEGFEQLTVARIRAVAGVPRRSFDANFEGVEDCFLAALELRAEHALSHAGLAYATGRSWPGGVHRALEALCAYLAFDPVLARIGFVEVFAPGLDGMRCRERLMASITKRFRDSAPLAQCPSELAAEASVGAIWGVLHHQLVAGQARRLPQIAPTLSFLALAPAIGAPAAADAIREEQAGRAMASRA